ncbi:DUF2301 domain-containing membrane protein [Tumidithrix elongata RA019]|uniref:DUF2301 domain-containing membrane protein n=1 Tax=Tumidithrix elongata BACA0141 TaxID=2716417 RepID=A0AAW9Q0P8_9CYAN|nr:DUF2301 domain-containing membrane protein [Tumidithrix elongata RA019]
MMDSKVYPEVYQGQFGTFTITDSDRQGVVVYRSALMVAAISFCIATFVVLSQLGSDQSSNLSAFTLVTWLYMSFSIALGVALATIHIYLATLHRALQIFLAIGSVTAIAIGLQSSEPLALTVYQQPMTLLGVGFTFAALTGIFFKEAFCFNRFETKILTLLVPLLLLGHLIKALPQFVEAILLAAWAGLFFVFALRKAIQPIPPDIGDKSVFDYLKNQNSITN